MDRLSPLNFAFSIADNKIGPEGAKFLAEMLTVSTSMTSVNLADNALCVIQYGEGTYDATGIKAIADALSVSSSMTSLNLAENQVGNIYLGNGMWCHPEFTGIKAIAKALSVSSSMNSLK